MAFIPVYHMIADYYPLYTPQTISAANQNNILAGQIICIRNTAPAGTVWRAAAVAAATDNRFIGVAGDSTTASTGLGASVVGDANGTIDGGSMANPGAGRMILGGIPVDDVNNVPQTYTAFGPFTQNRVSDAYNEPLASGKLTVYHGAGTKFWTDQFANDITWEVGQPVYSTTGGLFTNSNENSATALGYVFAAPQPYASGVPGTDVNGSKSLGFYIGIIWTYC